MSDVDRLSAALSDRYRVERELGAGGMATVYLAQDLRHDRKVAIKVLRPELAAKVGAERFLAEIKTTAALQHPHILPLHDSGEADGFLFYVMPYVRGESLRERLDREKQLAVDEAVAFTRKVADALDYAHEQGVVHRDIKPANVLLSERGEPLVADFGIALAVSQAGGGRITETGLSLGTPHYMSPEQATGDREVDPRSDVWALGCVLYEMLAGEPPFAAPSAQAVLARILTEDVRDVRARRRSVPEHVAAVCARALEKLPADRFPDAASLKAALDDPGYRYSPTTGAGDARHGGHRARAASPLAWPVAAGLAVAAFAVGAVATAWLGGESAPPAGMGTVVRSPLDSVAQSGWESVHFDVSPDGSAIVFRARPGPFQLIELDGPTRRELPGTEGGDSPIFSADGQDIAYRNLEGAVQRVSVDGGPPTTLTDNLFSSPTAWTEDGTLYYVGLDGTWRLREGGEPERLLDAGSLLVTAVRPLEGTEAILFTENRQDDTYRVMIRDLARGETHELIPDAFDARYVPTGHLVYGRPDRTVMSVPFDLDRLEVTGRARVVLDSVITDAGQGRMAFAVADNGSAVYLRGTPRRALRSGLRMAFISPGAPAEIEALPLRTDGLSSEGVGVSPDGGRAVGVRNDRVFVYDLLTYGETPMTAGDQLGIDPRWSPEGDRIAFAATGSGEGAVLVPAVKFVDSPEPPELLPLGGRIGTPTGWTPDGERLLVAALDVQGETSDLLIVDVATGEVTPWLESAYAESDGRVAPNGRWAAYRSNPSGPMALYVRPFPARGPALRLSRPGQEVDRSPAWSPGGEILYYMGRDSVYAVDVDGSGETFVAGEPEAVLARETEGGRILNLSLHPAGRLAVILRPPTDEAEDDLPPPPPPQGYVVVNWLQEMLDRFEGG